MKINIQDIHRTMCKNSFKYTVPIFVGTFIGIGYKTMQSVANNITTETKYGGRYTQTRQNQDPTPTKNESR